MIPVRFVLVGACFALLIHGQSATELSEPTLIKVGNEPIDVDMGYAAPYYVDFDGDGIRDLLVGQFGDGKLVIYRNTGTDSEPVFSDFYYFQAAGADGTVPTS